MRPGCSVARVPNCSAMVSGEWLGSMIPPEPRRIRSVWAAMWAMSTLVADDAIDVGQGAVRVAAQADDAHVEGLGQPGRAQADGAHAHE